MKKILVILLVFTSILGISMNGLKVKHDSINMIQLGEESNGDGINWG